MLSHKYKEGKEIKEIEEQFLIKSKINSNKENF